jgi:hypothetical protein
VSPLRGDQAVYLSGVATSKYTLDGATTWTSATEALRTLFFVDADTGWVVGDGGRIYKH